MACRRVEEADRGDAVVEFVLVVVVVLLSCSGLCSGSDGGVVDEHTQAQRHHRVRHGEFGPARVAEDGGGSDQGEEEGERWVELPLG